MVTFPIEEVRGRLRRELQLIADQESVLRPEWEPLLNSQRVVGALLVLEDLFPSSRIPPDKVVRRGGYRSVEEAIEDMLPRIERMLSKQREQEGGK